MSAAGRERSWLFVPGDRPERFAKAAACGADEVICDLEDAVAPEHKDAARREVARRLAPGPRQGQPQGQGPGRGGGFAYVRINGADTAQYAADVAAVAEAPGLRGVVLPKSEQVDQLHALIAALPRHARVIALVETALGVHQATALARVPGVHRLAFGSVDFALDVGARDEPEPLRYARSRLVLASRVAGIAAPLDGVTTRLDAPDVLAADARAARGMGFGGKLAIHPAQIDGINAAFGPTAQERDWAERVLTAVREAGGSAIRVDGQMIDRPRVELARRLLGSGA
ncbi:MULTISPECIES: HpcH/HpaI aldolase/citrate lyase family protein [Streptomyces]|uniref:HpcH/HpaI aldolase/citrate lyase family protein n=1 Tax=Streptomyces TaxID=1883 RepID=UPI00069A75A1|nr:CoA ester lyase [Streptomyces sp. SID7805]MYU51923.1 CoA ester lyase [Streptomyces sp. SID7805]